MDNYVLVCCLMAVTSLALAMPPTTVPPGVLFLCHDNTDCSSTRCCSKMPRFQVVSKRQLLPPKDFFVSSSCQPYLQANESCLYVMKINGDCGCAPNLICEYFPELDKFNPMNNLAPVEVPVLLPTQSNKREMIAASPESYKCVPKMVS